MAIERPDRYQSPLEVFTPDERMIASLTPGGDFFLMAYANGVDLEKPTGKAALTWERNVQITYNYFTTEDSYAKLAYTNSLSEKRIPAIAIRTVKRLWENAPQDLIEPFIRERFELHDPETTETRRIELQSLIEDPNNRMNLFPEEFNIVGKPFALITLARQYQDYLKKETNYPREQIPQAMGLSARDNNLFYHFINFAEQNGAFVPSPTKESTKYLFSLIRCVPSPRRDDNVNIQQLRLFFYDKKALFERIRPWHFNDSDIPLIAVSKIHPTIRWAPINNTVVVDRLEEQYIAVGSTEKVVNKGTSREETLTYIFIAEADKDAAIAVVEELNAEGRIREVLTQIVGPEQEYPAPTTDELEVTGNFITARQMTKILRKVNIKNTSNLPFLDFINQQSNNRDIPIPIYTYNGVTYIKTGDVQTLIDWLNS